MELWSRVTRGVDVKCLSLPVDQDVALSYFSSKLPACVLNGPCYDGNGLALKLSMSSIRH